MMLNGVLLKEQLLFKLFPRQNRNKSTRKCTFSFLKICLQILIGLISGKASSRFSKIFIEERIPLNLYEIFTSPCSNIHVPKKLFIGYEHCQETIFSFGNIHFSY